MNKIWIVLKTEFINTITRRSFLLTLILVPLVPAVILGGINLLGDQDPDQEGIDSETQTEQETPLSEGYVDLADIIDTIPDWVEEDRLISFSSESEAMNAISDGQISAFYIIQPDYLETGAVRYVREEFNPMSAMDNSGLFSMVLEYNLLGGDEQLYQAYQNPVRPNPISLEPETLQRDTSNPLSFYLPYGVTMLFYVTIFTSASLMMNSVAKEKENRVMEILMSSVKPNQLFTGKILGLGLVGLLQMIVWMGSAFLLLRLGGTTLNIPPSLQLPPEVFFWGIPFFILGYLLYATLMAGIGALVPNIKEASQATFVIIIPILIPLMMVGVIIEQPNATLPVILSLIPFTAPNTMMTRISVSQVPLVQLLTSIGLMITTIVLLIRAVSGMFRAQLLLTGNKFNLNLFIKALLGREQEIIDKA